MSSAEVATGEGFQTPKAPSAPRDLNLGNQYLEEVEFRLSRQEGGRKAQREQKEGHGKRAPGK